MNKVTQSNILQIQHQMQPPQQQVLTNPNNGGVVVQHQVLPNPNNVGIVAQQQVLANPNNDGVVVQQQQPMQNVVPQVPFNPVVNVVHPQPLLDAVVNVVHQQAPVDAVVNVVHQQPPVDAVVNVVHQQPPLDAVLPVIHNDPMQIDTPAVQIDNRFDQIRTPLKKRVMDINTPNTKASRTE